MDFPSVTTERLILRPYRNEDFEEIARMTADPDHMRFIGGSLDRETAHRSFCAVLGHWLYRGYGFWAVEERATGKLIGRAGLNNWEGYPGLEVGYGFFPSAWGKGYATEVAARCLRYAHEVVGARGVISLIDPGNVASERVVEKLGARRDREILHRDKKVVVWVHRDPQ
jgi:RimJ/RimL family protein N-acetyltransferase